jgi:hypothetical protein
MSVATPIREEVLAVDYAKFADCGIPVLLAYPPIFIAMAAVQSIAHDPLQSQFRERLGSAGRLSDPQFDCRSGQNEPQSQHIIGSLPRRVLEVKNKIRIYECVSLILSKK